MNGFDHNRVGIFEGDFNPIHNGHISAIKAFMEQMKLDYIFIVPRYIPDGRSAQRLGMCELALDGIDGVLISDTEIRGQGRITLCDVVRALSAENTRIFVLLGSDEVLSFDKKPDFEKILELCYPVYARREGDAIIEGRIVETLGRFYKEHGVMFRRILTETREISSTDIRRAIAHSEDVSGLVSADVLRFIKKNELYAD